MTTGLRDLGGLVVVCPVTTSMAEATTSLAVDVIFVSVYNVSFLPNHFPKPFSRKKSRAE